PRPRGPGGRHRSAPRPEAQIRAKQPRGHAVSLHAEAETHEASRLPGQGSWLPDHITRRSTILNPKVSCFALMWIRALVNCSRCNAAPGQIAVMQKAPAALS